MENYENESDQILVYGNISSETYSEQQKLSFLVKIFEE